MAWHGLGKSTLFSNEPRPLTYTTHIRISGIENAKFSVVKKILFVILNSIRQFSSSLLLLKVGYLTCVVLQTITVQLPRGVGTSSIPPYSPPARAREMGRGRTDSTCPVYITSLFSSRVSASLVPHIVARRACQLIPIHLHARRPASQDSSRGNPCTITGSWGNLRNP